MDEAILKRAMGGPDDEEEEEEEEYVEPEQPEEEEEEEGEMEEPGDEYDNATNVPSAANATGGSGGTAAAREAAGHLALEAETLPPIPAYEPAEIQAMEGINLVLEPLEAGIPDPSVKGVADRTGVNGDDGVGFGAVDLTALTDLPPPPPLLPPINRPRLPPFRTAAPLRPRMPRPRTFGRHQPSYYHAPRSQDYIPIESFQEARLREAAQQLFPGGEIPEKGVSKANALLDDLELEAPPPLVAPTQENPPAASTTETTSKSPVVSEGTTRTTASKDDPGELPTFDDYGLEDLPPIDDMDGQSKALEDPYAQHYDYGYEEGEEGVDEEGYYGGADYEYDPVYGNPEEVPEATMSERANWAVIDLTDDEGGIMQEQYRSVFLNSMRTRMPRKPQPVAYVPDPGDLPMDPASEDAPLHFPLQIPLSAPVPRQRFTPVPSQFLPPARTIVLPSAFQKHIKQLTQSANATPTTQSPDTSEGTPQNAQQQGQTSAPAATPGAPAKPLPSSQNPPAAPKRKMDSPVQASGALSQQAGPKKVKTEAKVNPWDVTDLTGDEDAKPLATPSDSQAPVESMVGVLKSGAVVTKKVEKGKEVEVVELDDKDWISFGEVSSSVVGCQYCQGNVVGKEKISLVRDHTNEHDSNALRVINSNRVQIGNIPSEISAILSPLIDQKILRLEASIAGAIGKYSIPISIHLFGPPEAELEVLAHCHNNSIFIKTRQIMAELQRDQIRQQAPVRPQPVFQPQQSEQISIEMTKQILEKLFDVLQDLQKNVPYTHDPPNLKTRLLPYQRQGLGWLRKREHPDIPKGKPFLFWEWKEKERVFHNVITGTSTPTKPELPRGGLLADEMGLGKTIQIISLLLSDPQEPPILNAKDIYATTDPPDSPQEYRASESFVNWGKTTLIVCPLSVVGNWVTQIDAHVEPGRLTYYVFHGTNRNTDPAFLQQHDVVITTYQVLAGDYQKDRLTGLLTIPWLRVVLDEAHSIKSKQTKQSLAAYCLKAERRWCITGTPLQNSLDDLYSLIRFLHISPFDDLAWWNKVFTKPLKNNESAGYSNLQALMQSLCLRRLKNMEINGKPIVNLPKRAMYLCKVKFSDEEMKRYKEMEAESSKTLESYMEQGNVADNYSHILVILGRLRQYCDHPSLCTTKETTHNKNEELSTILRDNECEDCSLCTFQITNPVITPCAHLFCRQCIERSLMDSPRCPNCGSPLTKKQLLDEESAPKTKKNFIYQASGIKNSAKMNALMGYLIQTRQRDQEIKNVVFSQWTSMLDLLEIPLRRAGINFVRLDGSMNRMNRELALSRFDTDPSITVFLISLKCGGLGLNLTAASQIFMMDPWWNPATEDQAIDRVHRIGQKRNVVVIKFVIEGSVEERVIELQTKKRELMDKAFGVERQSREARKENRIDDINFLVSGLSHRKE